MPYALHSAERRSWSRKRHDRGRAVIEKSLTY
jgi:hypothetical protein